MPFTMPLSDLKYSEAAQFDTHVNSLLNPPTPSDSLTNPLGSVSSDPTAGVPSPARAAPVDQAAFPPSDSPVVGTPPTAPDEVSRAISPTPAALPTPTPTPRTSQFGLGLSSADAYAACGPAAAIAFAQTYGRNPSAQEAMQLAREAGWTPDQGMAGVQSEQKLLANLGVATKLEQSVDWQHVAQDAQSGNPVILDTPGHYYYVDGYDPQKGFHVGTSGTDLKGGGEWMTADQINQQSQSHGPVRAALYADHPTTPEPSVAAQASPVEQFGEHVRALTSGAVDLGQQAVGAVQGATQTVGQTAQDVVSQFNDHVKTVTGGLVDLGRDAQGTQQAAPVAGGPTDVPAADMAGGSPEAISGLSQGATGAPSGPPAGTSTPPAGPEPSMWDKLGQGISDVFKNVFGGASQLQAGQEAQTRGMTQAADLAGGAIGNALTGAGGQMQTSLDLQRRGQTQIAEGIGTALTEPNPALTNVIGGQTAEMQAGLGMRGPLTPQEQYAQARGIASGLAGAVGPEELIARGAVTGAASLPKAADTLAALVKSRLPAESDINAAAGGLPSLLARLNQYSPEVRQGLEEFVTTQSTAGQDAAAIGDTVRQWMAANPPEAARALNPFQLETAAGPGRTLLTPDEAAVHLEDLTGRYQANDAQISALETQLHGGGTGAGQIVRPTWATGWSDAGLIQFARDNGFNPHDPTWGTYAADAAREAKGKYATAAKQTPTQLRAELARLRTENEQIAAAAEHAIDNGAGQLFRNDISTTPAPLPWEYNAASGPATAATQAEPAGSLARGSVADTGNAPQGARAASTARASATPPAESQLAPRGYPDYPAPPPEPAAAVPQSGDVVIQGLINEAKAKGYDTSALEAQLRPPETATGGGAGKPPVEPPPAATWDAEGNQVSGGPPPRPAGPPPVVRAGITPETVQMAHERINRAYPGDWLKQEPVHAQLDQMLANGAAPDEIARFLAGEVEGRKVSVPSIIRTVRTGSMAGGLSTEGKVALSPIIQTAMRAPVGAIKDILSGKPGDIALGLQGGLAGLAEGALDALQTIRYGTNYRAALTGGAQGGYGFTPGIDVMGKSPAARVAGRAALGLVTTHGALADVSAGIGRGAALARGATPAAAAETGQQWALRSGNYGTIGRTVSNALEGIKRTNPAMDVAGQILVPFFRVAYNAFTQGVERSPVGLLGTGFDVARQAAGKGPYAKGSVSQAVTPVGSRLANNMFGLGLAAFGLAQASQGNITGENPPPGSPRWSVRVNGFWVPLRALHPVGESLAQSAILYEAARDGQGDVAKMAEHSAAAYVGHVYDETWLRSVGDVMGAIGDVKNLAATKGSGAVRDLQYQAISLAKSFVPQQRLAEQTANLAQGKTPSGSNWPLPAFQAPTSPAGRQPAAPRQPAQPRQPASVRP